MDNVTLTSHLAGDTVDAIPKSPKLLVEEINYFYEKGISSMIVNLGEINLYNNEGVINLLLENERKLSS